MRFPHLSTSAIWGRSLFAGGAAPCVEGSIFASTHWMSTPTALHLVRTTKNVPSYCQTSAGGNRQNHLQMRTTDSLWLLRTYSPARKKKGLGDLQRFKAPIGVTINVKDRLQVEND